MAGLRRRDGVTIMELMVALLVLTVLGGLATSVYLFGAHALHAYQTTSAARAELSQAMDTAVGMMRQASSIDAISSGGVSFTADLGAGSNSFRLYLYNELDPEPNPPYSQAEYQLRLAQAETDYGSGAVLVSGLKPPGQVPFRLDGDVITLDWTVTAEDVPIRLRTAVRPRNL